MTDARSQRTRQQLEKAITQIGGSIRLEEMTVADVVQASGLSKSTVYRHAKSPATFMADRLRQVLQNNFFEILTRRGGAASTIEREQAHRESLAMVWHDGAAHFEMYRLSASQPDSIVLKTVMEAQLAAMTAFLRENLGSIELPRALADADPEWAVQVLAQQFSHGVVGLLTALLASAEMLALDDFIELARDLI